MCVCVWFFSWISTQQMTRNSPPTAPSQSQSFSRAFDETIAKNQSVPFGTTFDEKFNWNGYSSSGNNEIIGLLLLLFKRKRYAISFYSVPFCRSTFLCLSAFVCVYVTASVDYAASTRQNSNNIKYTLHQITPFSLDWHLAVDIDFIVIVDVVTITIDVIMAFGRVEQTNLTICRRDSGGRYRRENRVNYKQSALDWISFLRVRIVCHWNVGNSIVSRMEKSVL